MLSPETRQFIKEHEQADLSRLALQASRHPQVSMPEVIEQILGRRKAAEKLPSWHAEPLAVYPSRVSMEQCSSEVTARYKASLVSGQTLVDLTAGFGVDSYFFSKRVQQLHYCERHAPLAAIATHNFAAMGATNIRSHQTDGLDFLQGFQATADWIYCDPARRDTRDRKVVGLADCEPNVLENLDLLLSKSENVLIKASPMLDLKKAVRELRFVEQVWIVAVGNECKELLFHLTQERYRSGQDSLHPALHAVNLTKQGPESTDTFSGEWQQEAELSVALGQPKAYVYEPHAALMKSGLFNSLASKYSLSKIHAHSHLFFSDEKLPSFPGRSFECLKVLKFNKKELLKHLPDKKANITVRNFPITVAEIRKKTGIKEGGEEYLFATTDQNQQRIVLLCRKA